MKSKRRKTSDVVSKREETEQHVLEIAEELEEMNEDDDTLNLSEVQYRLWARMIVTGVHNSKESPPRRSQRKSQETSISIQLLLLSRPLTILQILPQLNHPKFSRQLMNLHPKVVASISGN